MPTPSGRLPRRRRTSLWSGSGGRKRKRGAWRTQPRRPSRQPPVQPSRWHRVHNSSHVRHVVYVGSRDAHKLETAAFMLGFTRNMATFADDRLALCRTVMDVCRAR